MSEWASVATQYVAPPVVTRPKPRRQLGPTGTGTSRYDLSPSVNTSTALNVPPPPPWHRRRTILYSTVARW